MTRRRTPREAAWLLASRGLLLVGLEMTAVRLGVVPQPRLPAHSPQILWAIGVR